MGDIHVRNYLCGVCGNRVSSNKGLEGSGNHAQIYSCTDCHWPTVFVLSDAIDEDGDRKWSQYPSLPAGRSIPNLPSAIKPLWDEIRSAYAAGAPTVSVLGCRKLLLHIAVEEANAAGDSANFGNFVAAIEYLKDNNFLPRNSDGWVDKVRTDGNEANHEVVMKTTEEAQNIVILCTALLTFMYELPNLATP